MSGQESDVEPKRFSEDEADDMNVAVVDGWGSRAEAPGVIYRTEPRCVCGRRGVAARSPLLGHAHEPRQSLMTTQSMPGVSRAAQGRA